MLAGFKKFVLRGNVVDLAVAVVIGAAFGTVVSSMVADVITPLVAAVVGKPDFSAYSLTLHGSQIFYGKFVNAVVSFLLVAAGVYFIFIAPMNAWQERRNRGAAPPDPTTRKCPECLSEVPIAARRCAHCTSSLPESAGA
jgi:large conductance mechanosensitive channel